MKKIALIFPGQGSQKVGMGREFYDRVPEARSVFDQANAVLGEDLSSIVFEGPEEKLMSTAYCQPAIFTMSVAALAALRASGKLSAVNVAYTAGLSLGEYGALHAAGVLAFEDSLKLIQKRAAFMEEAARAEQGKMAAIIGFDKDKLLDICKASGCEVANFNSPEQIVITGRAAAVEKACQLIAEAGGKKVFPLDVSGAFHSSLMRPAAAKFSGALVIAPVQMTGIKVVANVNGMPYPTVKDIRAGLEQQIFSSVQWVDSVRFMVLEGVTDMVEVGPGRVLKGLIRKIDPAVNVHNVQTPEDISALSF